MASCNHNIQPTHPPSVDSAVAQRSRHGAWPPPRFQRLKNNEICHNYQFGNCQWGERCHRIHVDDNNQSAPTPYADPEYVGPIRLQHPKMQGPLEKSKSETPTVITGRSDAPSASPSATTSRSSTTSSLSVSQSSSTQSKSSGNFSTASSTSSAEKPLRSNGNMLIYCRDYARGSCVRAYCKYPHLERDQILQLSTSTEDRSPLATQGRLDGSRNEPRSVEPRRDDTQKPGNSIGKDKMTEIAQDQGMGRAGVAAPRSQRQRPNSKRSYSASNQNPSPPNITVPSAEPLVPPGLGLEARLGISSDNPRVPEPPPPITITITDSAKATFGPGFQVQKVITSFESRRIIIENLPTRTTILEVTAILEPFGEAPSVELSESTKGDYGSSTTARATFVDHKKAGEAAALLDGATIFGRKVSVRLASHKSTSLGHGTIRDTDVLLEFPSPHRTGYAGYPSEKLAQAAVKAAHNTELRGAWVTAEIHRGLPRVGLYTVRFWGLPPDAKVADLNKYGQNEDVMFERPNYQSLAGSTRGLREYVESIGEPTSFNVLPPPYKRQIVRVWANFSTPQIAAKVCQVIHGRRQGRFGNMKVYAHHIKALTYNLPGDVYDSISSDIALLRSLSFEDETGMSISTNDRRHLGDNTMPVTVKLGSESLSSLTKLKVAFDRILKGEKVVENGEIVWDGFFTRAVGISFVEELEKKHRGIKINRDTRRRTLALFGPAQMRNVVRSEILAKVASLRSRKERSFPIPGNLIGLFMSADLAKLQEEIGRENVTISLARRTLSIRGDEDAYKVARLAIIRARDRHHSQKPPSGHQSCPVCLDKVTAPVTLQCGHTWCKACLSDYLIASIDSKVFPLTCLGNEATCKELMSLDVAQELLSPNQFEAVLKAAFLAFVHSHPSEFYYCPTPDCEQIYRKALPGTVLQCPSCLVRICATCHFEDHEGGKCPDMDTEDQQMFNDWKTHHDVKGCPGCRAPIERAAGCNHMTCARCKTHICWECLATFEKSEDVYHHMHNTHGGIGV